MRATARAGRDLVGLALRDADLCCADFLLVLDFGFLFFMRVTQPEILQAVSPV
jgi:hypothetical protein